MPLPRRVTLMPRQRVPTTPPLNLESCRGRRRGGPSGQVTVDQVDRLSRVLGHDCKVKLGAWREGRPPRRRTGSMVPQVHPRHQHAWWACRRLQGRTGVTWSPITYPYRPSTPFLLLARAPHTVDLPPPWLTACRTRDRGRP